MPSTLCSKSSKDRDPYLALWRQQLSPDAYLYWLVEEEPHDAKTANEQQEEEEERKRMTMILMLIRWKLFASCWLSALDFESPICAI